MSEITETLVSKHVLQLAVPTPTMPPAMETNSYLVFDGDQGLLVDLGTQEPALVEAVVKAVKRAGVRDIMLLATHYHRDHTQGLPFLQAQYRHPIYLHPLDTKPALTEMQISRDLTAPAPAQLKVGDTLIKIEHRPGHTHGHLHLQIPEDEVVLLGDHLAGTGSVWIGPPDGHLSDYYNSLDTVIQGDCVIAGPGHGPIIENAQTAAVKQKQHRQDRELQILDQLAAWQCIDDLVASIYQGSIPAQAIWAARKTVQAHLQFLLEKNSIEQHFNQQRMCTEYIRKKTTSNR